MYSDWGEPLFKRRKRLGRERHDMIWGPSGYIGKDCREPCKLPWLLSVILWRSCLVCFILCCRYPKRCFLWKGYTVDGIRPVLYRDISTENLIIVAYCGGRSVMGDIYVQIDHWHSYSPIL